MYVFRVIQFSFKEIEVIMNSSLVVESEKEEEVVAVVVIVVVVVVVLVLFCKQTHAMTIRIHSMRLTRSGEAQGHQQPLCVCAGVQAGGPTFGCEA